MINERYRVLSDRAGRIIRAMGAEEITLVVDTEAVGIAVSSYKVLGGRSVYTRTDFISLKERTRLVTFQATPNLAVYIGSGIEPVGGTKIEDEVHLMPTPCQRGMPDAQSKLELFVRICGSVDEPTDEFIIYTL